jgi:O-antigen/teichoic acid export membrane protein
MKIVENYIYNTLYQILILITPFITLPYVTRIFSPLDLGINSYTVSIVNYFMFFGTLGMALYGNREIAYVRDDETKLRETFWALLLIQLLGSFATLIIYYFIVLIYVSENEIIYIIQGVNILSIMLDISWLFMGLEEFKKISLRNTIVKVIGVISVFLLVKSSKDLLIYIALNVFTNVSVSLIMWFSIPQRIRKIKINILTIRRNLKQLVVLFIPQIFIQVYALLDRVLVGLLSTMDQVSFYDYSQKIIRIILALITSLGVVFISRISNMSGNGKIDDIKLVIEKEFEIIAYVASPIAFGLMATSNNLIPLIFGENYSYIAELTSFSSVIVIAVSLANVIGVQYLVGTKQENKYSVAIVVSAIVDFAINIILIGKIGAAGAVVAVVVAEFVGIIIQLVLVRKQLPIVKMLRKVIKYFLGAVTMFAIIIPIGILISNKIISILIQILIGSIVYISIMCLSKDETQKQILEGVIKIFK